jgi:hypothetical protein
VSHAGDVVIREPAVLDPPSVDHGTGLGEQSVDVVQLREPGAAPIASAELAPLLLSRPASQPNRPGCLSLPECRHDRLPATGGLTRVQAARRPADVAIIGAVVEEFKVPRQAVSATQRIGSP